MLILSTYAGFKTFRNLEFLEFDGYQAIHRIIKNLFAFPNGSKDNIDVIPHPFIATNIAKGSLHLIV